MTNFSEREQTRRLKESIKARSDLERWLTAQSPFPTELPRIEMPYPSLDQFPLKPIHDDILWWIIHRNIRLYRINREEFTIGIEPHKDDLYEWVDVEVIVGSDRAMVGKLSYLVEQNHQERNLTLWEGTHRQRLKGFLAGEVDQTKLIPFKAPIETKNVISEKGIIPLFKKGKESVELYLTEVPEDFMLRECTVRPYVNEAGETMIDCLDESGKIFSRFIYRGSDLFESENQYRAAIERSKKKREEILEAAKAYIKTGGKLSLFQLRKIGMQELASDIHYYFGGVKGLREALFGPEAKRSKTSEANDYLRNLAFGEEEK